MNDGENYPTTSQEDRYAEVSLRAVELLAKAQRAADEAVAEAQSYARDLENSAREQYKQILQRAQAAAQQVATAEGARGEATAPGGSAAVDAQQLAYVRTYARVAHTQLKSVLAALNEELDQLAAMAEGGVPGPGSPSPPAPTPPARTPAPGVEREPQFTVPVTMTGRLPSPQPSPHPSPSPSPSPSPPSSPPATPAPSSGPPVSGPSRSISYFHRGSAWDGPH